MNQADVYRRIAAAMPHDEEVQALCRKHTQGPDATVARYALVLSLLEEMGETTAEEMASAADGRDGRGWTPRGVVWYLSRLAKGDGHVVKVADSRPTRYAYIP